MRDVSSLPRWVAAVPVSPVRTFTGAVRRLSEYEVLTTLPMHRTIAWDESDEVSLLVPAAA